MSQARALPAEVAAGRILVIDDEPAVRKLLRRLLETAGYEVTESGSAENGLHEIRTDPPDLVFLDVQLPDRSGHEVLEAVRADPATRLLPVIMLTGMATRPEKIRSHREGVTDYMAHRFDPRQRSDPEGAIAGAPEDAVRILLAHQPRSARLAALAGYQLQLSGHTHGGQFWPWNHFVRFQQPWTAGLQRLGSLWIYINRGTGYWGPPLRLGPAPEITELTLVRA